MLRKKYLNGVEIVSLEINELKRVLEEAASRIKKERPEVERIILFGSFTRGDFTPYSDLDIAIIVDKTNKSFIERQDDYIKYFLKIPLDVNIVVYTKAEIEHMKKTNGLFIREVLKGQPLGAGPDTDFPMDINIRTSRLSELFEEVNAVAAYLFGSCAKKDTGPLSDIDVAVLLPEMQKELFFEKKLALSNKISSMFHKNNVDVVILNKAPITLRFNVINEGIVIFETVPNLRYKFESETMISYIETKPLREKYNEMLLRNIREGRFL